MTMWKVFLITALVWSGGLWAESDRVLEQNDFAWGISLEPTTSSPFYQLPLPPAVYQGVTRADLGDLRLFNSKGHLLPHELLLPPLNKIDGESLQPVKLFPLYGSRTADLQLLSMRISRSTEQGQLTLEQRQLYREQDEVLRGYLLQLWEGEKRPKIQSLKLQWPAQSKGFIHQLRLEQSDDLSRWRPLDIPAVMADLGFAGERLVRREIDLPIKAARYIRLTRTDGELPVELVSVDAMISGRSVAQPQSVLNITTVKRGEQPGEYLFEMPGRLPVTGMDLIPGERNTIVRATLYSRPTEKAAWISRSSGRVFRLMVNETPFEQTKLVLNRTSDRYWKLIVDETGGGLGEALPTIKINWLPHQLQFAARGEGPFLLAYGSARAKPSQGTSLLNGFSALEQEQLVSESIVVGEPLELGGSTALSVERSYDWKEWSLWGVLILATLLLGWMAWSTLRQMNRAGR
jgi:hypothetical protein